MLDDEDTCIRAEQAGQKVLKSESGFSRRSDVHERLSSTKREGRTDFVRPSAIRTAAASGAAAILLAACSGQPQSNSEGLPATANAVRPANTTRTVFVAQKSQSDVLQFQYNRGNFTEVGTVPSAAASYSLWIDRARNLYVGNYQDPTTVTGAITEYNEWGDLIFTYSSGIGTVRAVTVDRYGNVFEGDDGPSSRGNNAVREFPQGVNTPIATCTPPTAVNGVWGVAVDKQGDVFVDYLDYFRGGNLYEYPHGLIASGCNGVPLFQSSAGSFASGGGIALDRQRNLVICDQGSGHVWILSPPYSGSSTIVALVSGLNNPDDVTITKGGTEAYVSDFGAKVTKLLNYPSGTTIATIGQPSYAPSAAVDIYNFTP